MANVFDQFDSAPMPMGASATSAPSSDAGTPNVSSNPFDQFGPGLSDQGNSPEGALPSSGPATPSSILKQVGIGALESIPQLVGAVQGALTPPPSPFAPVDQQVIKPSLPGIIDKGLGLIGLNPEEMAKPQNGPERIGRTVGNFVGPMLIPGVGEAGVASRAASGATAGLGAGLAEEAAPDSLKPLAGIAGGIVGGALGEVAPSAIGTVASKGLDYGATLAAPVSSLAQGRLQTMAGRYLAEKAANPEAALNAINTAPRELVPGSQPTTFQLTGDMGLGALERATATKNPQMFQDLRAEQNAARLNALTDLQSEGHPEAVSGFFRDQLSQLDQDTQAAYDNAATQAKSAAENIGGDQPIETLGENVRSSLQNNLDALKSRESALWKAVDPNGTLMTVATPVKNAVQSIYGNMSPETQLSLSPIERNIANVVSDYGQILPFQRLIGLRSAVSQAMRDVKSPLQPNNMAYGRLSQLRGAVEDAISDSIAQKAATEQQAVAEGALQPQETMIQRLTRESQEFMDAKRSAARSGSLGETYSQFGTDVPSGSSLSSSEVGKGSGAGSEALGTAGNPQAQGTLLDDEAANRLKAASQATAERAQTFGASPVKQILKRPGTTMPYNMPAGSVASNVWKAGNAGADTLNAVLKASPEAVEPVRQIAASSLRSLAKDGVITPQILDTWKSRYAPALKALEQAAPGSTAPFENAAKAGEHLASVAADRKAALDAYQKDAVGKLLKVDDPADVTKTVGSLFNRNDSVKLMRQLAQEASKDPEALKGLRKAIVDYMSDRLVSNTEAGTSGKNLIKSDAFQTFLGKNHTALRQVFSDQELNSMRAIAQDLKRANRSITAVKLPGGSNTAQDRAAISKYSQEPTILSKIFFHALGVAGGIESGIGGLIGLLGTHVVSAMRESGLQTVDDLVRDALLDPDLAKTLLMKAPKRVGAGSELSLLRRLRDRSLLGGGVAAVQNVTKAPSEKPDQKSDRR